MSGIGGLFDCNPDKCFFLPALAVIVTVPFDFAVTMPFWETVAILLLMVPHFTLSVLFAGTKVA